MPFVVVQSGPILTRRTGLADGAPSKRLAVLSCLAVFQRSCLIFRTPSYNRRRTRRGGTRSKVNPLLSTRTESPATHPHGARPHRGTVSSAGVQHRLPLRCRSTVPLCKRHSQMTTYRESRRSRFLHNVYLFNQSSGSRALMGSSEGVTHSRS